MTKIAWLLLAILVSTMPVVALAQDVDKQRFEAFATASGLGLDHPIRWRRRVTIDVFFAKPVIADDADPNDLDTFMKQLGVDNVEVNGVILDRSFGYSRQLAASAGLTLHIRSTESIPDIMIGSVHKLHMIPSSSTSSTEHTIGIRRQNAAGDDLCTLQLAWKDDAIRSARIEIVTTASKAEAARCADEFIWRSLGFPGSPDSAPSWADETLTEGQKVAMLKRLYGAQP